MDAWKYDIYFYLFLVLNEKSNSFASLTREINTRNKCYISAHPCIIVYLIIVSSLMILYDISLSLMQTLFCHDINVGHSG